MRKFLLTTASFAVLANSAFGAIYTVDHTGILDPNPSNFTINEVGNTSLAASRLLVAAAHTAGRGGVVDFQQRNQGGTFPNSSLPDNGQDFANGVTNPLYVTNGATGDGLVGSPIFSFYRSESTGAGVTNGVNNFDSNLNNSVISGGFDSRYPGAVSASNPSGDGHAVNGINAAYSPNITTAINGGYMGITNLASPATMVFNNPLSFFAITAVPRGADRTATVTMTLSNNATVAVGPGSQTSAANDAIFFGYSAPVGLTITSAAITTGGGTFVRFDDLAFVVTAVPEPTSLTAIAAGSLVLIRRRRVSAV